MQLFNPVNMPVQQQNSMELINYLSRHFLTLPELLNRACVSENTFRALQRRGLQPESAYKLNLGINCDSMFGEHNSMAVVEYYPRASVEWLQFLLAMDESRDAFDSFCQRYCDELKRLGDAGFVTTIPAFNQDVARHLREEWRQYLDGSFGVCTRSGQIEEIAAKSLATAIIQPYLRRDTLRSDEKLQLKRAVDLLASVSADYAPHERARSNRYKLIERVRSKFKLGSSPLTALAGMAQPALTA
jgi:hypothetical protein